MQNDLTRDLRSAFSCLLQLVMLLLFALCCGPDARQARGLMESMYILSVS